MDEITVLENFFKSRQVLLARQWLESCITWCKQENLPRNYTIKDLQFNVFEQWLLLDLRDVEIACLPPDLSNKIKYTLAGNYSLQIMQIEDISRPKHWQLQRIRRGIQKNLEQEAETSKRVLLVTLTDGVQEIQATEYQPVKCLHLNLSPGIKVRLMGPIDVRRGRLMLAERNIKILGGEVDSLLVSNAAENVMAKHLNMPLNMEPAVIQESMLTADAVFLDGGNSAANLPSNQVPSTNGSLATRTTNPQLTCSNQNKQEQSLQIPDEVDFMQNEQSIIEDEIAMMMEVEHEFEESVAKRKKPNVEVFTNMDEDDLLDDAALVSIEIPDTVEVPQATENIHEESDFFTDIDLDAHLDKIEEESKPITPLQPQVWTIEKLAKNLPHISRGKFKIRAKFKSVIEKMAIVDNEFRLVIKVTDDSGSDVDVKLHTDVVGELFGCSALAATDLKSEVMKQNAEAKGKLLDGLRRLKEELTKLDRIAEVEVNAGDKFPVLVRLM